MTLKEMVALSRNGMSIPAIARSVGLSAEQVRYQFSKGNIAVSDVQIRKPLSICERVFLAAVMDCEGTITARVQDNKQRTPQIMYCFRVEMTHDAIPRRCERLCGGQFIDYREKPGNRKKQCLWNAGPRVIRWLLPQIMPYLMVKLRQAEIVSELLENRRRGHRTDFHKQTAVLLAELRTLNKKGKRKDVICVQKG